MKVKYYPLVKTMNLISIIDRHRDPIEMDKPQSIQWCGIEAFKTHQAVSKWASDWDHI